MFKRDHSPVVQPKLASMLVCTSGRPPWCRRDSTDTPCGQASTGRCRTTSATCCFADSSAIRDRRLLRFCLVVVEQETIPDAGEQVRFSMSFWPKAGTNPNTRMSITPQTRDGYVVILRVLYSIEEHIETAYTNTNAVVYPSDGPQTSSRKTPWYFCVPPSVRLNRAATTQPNSSSILPVYRLMASPSRRKPPV